MRRLYNFVLLLGLLMVPSLLQAQYTKLQGWAQNGGTAVTIPGTQGSGSQKFQQTYPSATVTVFDAGTTNIATTYLNSTGTLKTSPFASATNGQWFFYCNPGNHYDVKFSNGGIPVAFTLGDQVCPVGFGQGYIPCILPLATDSGVVINSCFLALPSGGGTVVAISSFSTGVISTNPYAGISKTTRLEFGGATTFAVSATIQFPSNTTIIGAGPHITIFQKVANIDLMAQQHFSNIELADFTIDGNYSAGYTQNDLSFEFLNQFYFHNLELKNANLKGLACAACYNGDIGDNFGHNNQQDSFETGSIASAYYTITGVTNTNPIVITVSACGACSPIAIGNSIVVKGVTGTTSANGGPVGVTNVSGLNITVQIAGNGAYVNGGTLTNELDNSWNITVHDNRASSDGIYSFACIVPSDNREPSPHDLRYTGNYAEMNPLYGFESKGCNHNSWVNNHSQNNTTHGFNLGTPGAGTLNYLEDSDTIVGNTSWNNGTPGAKVDGMYFHGTNSIIANNTVGDTRTSPGQKTGIQINQDGNNSITNNNGSGNATDLVCGPDVGTNIINQVGYVTTCP